MLNEILKTDVIANRNNLAKNKRSSVKNLDWYSILVDIFQ